MEGRKKKEKDERMAKGGGERERGKDHLTRPLLCVHACASPRLARDALVSWHCCTRTSVPSTWTSSLSWKRCACALFVLVCVSLLADSPFPRFPECRFMERILSPDEKFSFQAHLAVRSLFSFFFSLLRTL